MAYNAGASDGNLVLIQSQTVVSASPQGSVNFTSGMTGYDVYVLRYYNCYPSVDGATLWLGMSTNSGVSYLNTNYKTIGYLNYVGNFGGIYDNAGPGCQLIFQQKNTSAAAGSGLCTMYGFSSSTLPKTTTNTSTYLLNNAGAANDCNIGIGSTQISTSIINAITVFYTSGNITAGVFTLYGVQN